MWVTDFAKSVSEAWVRTYPQNHVTWLNLAYVTWHASSFLPYHTHLTYLTSTSPRIREIRTTVASNGRSACSRTSVIRPRRLRTRPLPACLVRSGPCVKPEGVRPARRLPIFACFPTRGKHRRTWLGTYTKSRRPGWYLGCRRVCFGSMAGVEGVCCGAKRRRKRDPSRNP